MHEFQFTVRYEAGADDLMDVFRSHPRLRARSSVCFVTESTMWRIDQVSGPPDALEAFDGRFLDESTCNECLDDPGCNTYRRYRVLDRTPNARTVYTFREEIADCHSVPYIVVDRIGDGVVFQATRSEAEYRWKVLYPGDQPIGELYDEIEATLRPGLTLELDRLTQHGNWNPVTKATAALSGDHWEILETASELGYYDRPRAVTVAELASELGIARSTAQYRLRTAEDHIIQSFLDGIV